MGIPHSFSLKVLLNVYNISANYYVVSTVCLLHFVPVPAQSVRI